MKSYENLLMKIIVGLLILFGLYLTYQIIKKSLGGSWTSEDIIIAILIFNLGAIFTVGLSLSELKSNHGNLAKQFSALANDFKDHIKNIRR
ncbi:hypothetical protein J4404_03545 [Candidatus Woesearchaeota archaeon]|nr:hypothetical protein [Candidatus Woesearchaeota archaeon]